MKDFVAKKLKKQENQHQAHNVPVSLGKPSLRRRLEAYYSLIAPELISDASSWKQRFDQIWEKFGGTHDGEAKLAKKLANKYGATVRLLLASSAQKEKPIATVVNPSQQRSEVWYQLNEKEKDSGVLDFTSDTFDPKAALHLGNEELVVEGNPWISACPRLDRVDMFRSYLPSEDPLFRFIQQVPRKPESKIDSNVVRRKQPSCFAAIAEQHKVGPFSILHQAFVNRQRVRVVIRYVNGIRGTLTGYVLAFDKHMNMILRDVDELYSPRTDTRSEDGPLMPLSYVEIELRRRNVNARNQIKGISWSVRQRHMRQLLVRGDNVVLVYRADNERSAWPSTAKSPAHSEYRSTSLRIVPDCDRIGTPGSLVLLAHRQHFKGHKSDYSS